MRTREVSLFPNVPDIAVQDERAIATLTEIAFGSPVIHSRMLPPVIDTLMCFASNEGHQRQGRSIAQLFNGKAEIRQLIMTGGADWKVYPDLPDLCDSIAHATWRAIDGAVPASTHLVIEDQSTNTKEGVVMGWDRMNDPPGETFVISALAYHIGRCHRTLQAEAVQRGWNGTVLYYPYQALDRDPEKGIVEVRADTWWQSGIAAMRVWGEALRIYRYAQRGDVQLLPGDEDRFGLLQKSGLQFDL